MKQKKHRKDSLPTAYAGTGAELCERVEHLSYMLSGKRGLEIWELGQLRLSRYCQVLRYFLNQIVCLSKERKILKGKIHSVHPNFLLIAKVREILNRQVILKN